MGRTGYDMKFSLSLFPDWYEFVRCQANRESVNNFEIVNLEMQNFRVMTFSKTKIATGVLI